MADNNPDDDIYNDPDTIGDVANDEDIVNGAPDNDLTDEEEDDLSQSIYTPEKDTTDLDDRGDIDELEEADDGDAHDAMDGQYPEDADPDSDHLGDVIPKDEDDNTED